jgi:osmotically-inducible protein OsmY
MKAAEVMITNVITVVDKALAQLPSVINVIVQDGTVELWGIVDSASEKKTVRVAAEATLEVREREEKRHG